MDKIYPAEVLLEVGVTGLPKDSVAMVQQIRTVAHSRLESPMGSLQDMEQEKKYWKRYGCTLKYSTKHHFHSRQDYVSILLGNVQDDNDGAFEKPVRRVAMRYFRKIVGKRLYLSPFDPGDSESYTKWAKWMNNRAISDTYGGHHILVTTASAKKFISELQGHRFDIVLLDSDVLIGHISLHDIDHFNRHAFLGIVIGEDEYHNKGYGTEAVRLILDYGFNTLNLHNIMLSVHADNYAGITCYKKVGFQDAGRRREWIFKDGKYIDVLYMDILAKERLDADTELKEM